MEPLQSITIALFCFVSAVHCQSVTIYTNSSTTSSSAPAITAAPVYCGDCTLYYEVHAHVWWSSLVTNTVATLVYTVDNGTGSTIGSSYKFSPNTTAFQYGTNFTDFAGVNGSVEYTTFSAYQDAQLATLVQTNYITMNGSKNGYGLHTINSTFNGSVSTHCDFDYYSPNPTNTSDLPGLPASTEYAYTTVIPYDAKYNMSNALGVGLDSLASEVATYLHLSVPSCTYYGGGVGTLKVPVLPFTITSTSYGQAALPSEPNISLESAVTVTVTTQTATTSPPPALSATVSSTGAPIFSSESSVSVVSAITTTSITSTVILTSPTAVVSNSFNSESEPMTTATELTTETTSTGTESLTSIPVLVTTILATIPGNSASETISTQVTLSAPASSASTATFSGVSSIISGASSSITSSGAVIVESVSSVTSGSSGSLSTSSATITLTSPITISASGSESSSVSVPDTSSPGLSTTGSGSASSAGTASTTTTSTAVGSGSSFSAGTSSPETSTTGSASSAGTTSTTTTSTAIGSGSTSSAGTTSTETANTSSTPSPTITSNMVGRLAMSWSLLWSSLAFLGLCWAISV